MEAYRNYSLEFYLENPDDFQEGPPIWIRTTGISSALSRVDSYPRGDVRQVCLVLLSSSRAESLRS